MRTIRLSRFGAPGLGIALLGVVLLGASACDSDSGGGGAEATAGQVTGVPGPTVDPEAGTPVPPKSEPTPVRPVVTGKPGEGKGSSLPGKPSAPPTGPATAPQLTAALLAQAELAATGLRVDGPDRAKDTAPNPDPPPAVPAVDRPECAVFAQVSVFDGGAPEAWAHREYADAAKPDGARLGVTLSSHRDDRGAALLPALDRAMAGCSVEFAVRAGGPAPEQWSVAPVDGAPLAGDETTAYRVTVRTGTETRVETVVLVRFGATTAQFVYPGDAAPDAAPYAAVITGQVQKARALLGR
ncbi:hypothetical protein [Streptodolium elevatio]|uniref:Lipoprotein n=1 Tax=Streptodolium elevatio TaxID=3157996 RepID=A0ABV3DF32_9ACTN